MHRRWNDAEGASSESTVNATRCGRRVLEIVCRLCTCCIILSSSLFSTASGGQCALCATPPCSSPR